MKIVIICRPLVFHGGIERATAGLLRGLVERGDRVELLTPGPDPGVPGVGYRRLVMPPSPPPLRPLVLAMAVAVARRRSAWDIVQSHERVPGATIYRAGEGCHRAWLAARARRGRGLYNAVVLALERRVLTTTPRIVAIARAGKGEIEKLYGVPPRRVSVVYNGVDHARFCGDSDTRAAARAEAGLGATDHALLFVGSGFERKGLGTAIDALSRLGDDVRLLVVGKGDAGVYRERAERLSVAHRVAWLGTRPDVERWYAAADAVVLPTIYEPFGNVHLEALAAGVPIVTTTRAGGAELVDDACGAVTDPGDPDAIAAAVIRLRERPVAEVREACRAAAAPFTYTAQAAGFHEAYRGARSDRP